MRSWFVMGALLVASSVVACGGGGTGGTAGTGGTGGTGGMGGSGGMAGMGGAGGSTGGTGGTGGTDPLMCAEYEDGACTPQDGESCMCDECVDTAQCGFCDGDGTCNDTDACTCEECWTLDFCLSPTNCTDDGVCEGYNEGCLCADCASEPNCANFTLPEDCSAPGDEDGDGAENCADTDCAMTGACGYCNDDGMCDTATEACTCLDCATELACTAATDCVAMPDGVCQEAVEGCNCPDCAMVANCAMGHEDCDNGMDDNGDMKAECADPECAFFPGCFENCSDGVDNDNDMLIDCADDAELSGAPSCKSTAFCGACDNNGTCDLTDACTCDECATDSFCTDPANCTDDGVCDQFIEGCQCADCAMVPNCL